MHVVRQSSGEGVAPIRAKPQCVNWKYIALRADFHLTQERSCQHARGKINSVHARATLPWYSFQFGFWHCSDFDHRMRRR